MRKLLPILLLLLGLGAGAGAGWYLQPHPEPDIAAEESAHGEGAENEGEHGGEDHGASAGASYSPPPANTETVRMPNQFAVPLITDGRVRAMVVVGVALELTEGHEFSLSRDEPRLRAAFLQLFFDHANIGGFDGVFTSGEALLALRRALRDTARQVFGPSVHDVLITELMRQET